MKRLITIFNKFDKNSIDLLKGSSIAFFIKIAGMLFGYITMLFITKNHGAEEWGIYSLCITILSIVILLPKFGFDNSLVRIITELIHDGDKKAIRIIIFKVLTISITISLIVIFILNYFSDYIILGILNQNEISPLIKPISFAVIPMVIIVIIAAMFQALKKTLLFMLFKATVINIIFLLLLIWNKSQAQEFRVFELYVFSVGISFLIGVLIFIFLFKKVSLPSKKENKKYTYKLIAKTSIPMLFSSSVALFMGWSDILILSYYSTTKDIGIYNSTLKLAAIALISLAAINAVTTPKFAEYYSKKDFKSLKSTVQKSTRMIFYTSAPLLFILIIFSKSILSYFGEEFTIGYLALTYLCMAKFINSISGSVGYIMQMTDQQKTYQNIIIIAFFINLVLNFLLIPKYGFNGAAIASSIAMAFWNITLVFIIRKKLGFWTIYIPFITK